MFNFLNMMGDYEFRKVDNYSQGDVEVDTCRVTDSDAPYETAVAHPKYNSGKWVIVETYFSEDAAQEGHNRWVATMTAETLPDKLTDVSSAGVAGLVDLFGGDDWRENRITT